jgi:enterochelin esterase-like enzyme
VPDSHLTDEMALTFELADRAGRLASARLVQEVGLPGPLDLVRSRGVWRLEVERPAVDRMEYLFDIEDHNGNRATIQDPANPLRAGGAFGDKSVREFAGYRAPGWLDADSVPAEEIGLDLDAPDLGAELSVTVWTPADLDPGEPAPLLVVHDGPEYAKLGGFTHYLGASIATGALPPVRAALLGPGDRNAWYSANPDYARTLGTEVVAALDKAAPATRRIGVGVSLGALAMLHAHRSRPGMFDALLLQSGSFFTPRLDPQESQFSGFPAVTAFVADMATALDDAAPVPTVLTCGAVEENLANNQAMAGHLHRLGYPTRLVEVCDAHNYTAWRDALDPHLTRLITGAADEA